MTRKVISDLRSNFARFTHSSSLYRNPFCVPLRVPFSSDGRSPSEDSLDRSGSFNASLYTRIFTGEIRLSPESEDSSYYENFRRHKLQESSTNSERTISSPARRRQRRRRHKVTYIAYRAHTFRESSVTRGAVIPGHVTRRRTDHAGRTIWAISAMRGRRTPKNRRPGDRDERY